MAGAIGAAALAAGVICAAPAAAATSGSTGTAGWHWVHEGWQPAVQGDLTLPAARYCGTFDLKLVAVSQDVRGKVLSRWDNGTPKDTYYTGPLTTKAINEATGKSKDYFMGGAALESDSPAGAIQTYQTFGPVGVGMPAGASQGLSAGFYVVRGYHEIRFNADGTREVTVAKGPATNICTQLG